jgi:hypothetical protein
VQSIAHCADIFVRQTSDLEIYTFFCLPPEEFTLLILPSFLTLLVNLAFATQTSCGNTLAIHLQQLAVTLHRFSLPGTLGFWPGIKATRKVKLRLRAVVEGNGPCVLWCLVERYARQHLALEAQMSK